MARIHLAQAAVEDLDRLIATLSLPADTRNRVARALAPVAQHPLLGPELAGRWEGLRFVLGPWRWMVFVYRYDIARDEVVVVTVQDARSAGAAPGER